MDRRLCSASAVAARCERKPLPRRELRCVPDYPRITRFAQRREQKHGALPRDAAILIIAVWLVAVILWGVAEHFVDGATFPTVWLGMWWALETVTNVGYGDVVPASAAGRGVAWLLLLGGLAFFSVITATITSTFVARAQREAGQHSPDVRLRRLSEVQDRFDRIEQQLQQIADQRDPPRDQSR